jgi:succinate dehydrogenase flavin-adding protein (antitoxin of CptAB toxin-antitoxin module)
LAEIVEEDAVKPLVSGHDMSEQDKISYHSQRAMRELDLGLTAGCIPAARAHMQLSALHMEKVRELSGGAVKPALSM